MATQSRLFQYVALGILAGIAAVCLFILVVYALGRPVAGPALDVVSGLLVGVLAFVSHYSGVSIGISGALSTPVGTTVTPLAPQPVQTAQPVATAPQAAQAPIVITTAPPPASAQASGAGPATTAQQQQAQQLRPYTGRWG